jgi:hypothetical protein
MTPSTYTKPPKPSRLEAFRPVRLTPQSWPQLLRDDHPLGAVLDFGRG